MDIASMGIVNIILISIICLSSFFAFSNSAFLEKNLFDPYRILVRKEYYRLISAAFIHANLPHLIFNCFSLYSFGEQIELRFGLHYYLVIFFASVIGGNLLSLSLHKNHEYQALGASGGVCGIIFASIFLVPGGSVYLFFIPIPIPASLYAILFLLISIYGIKSERDNIGHDAHLGGAIIGLLITTILEPQLIGKSLILYFTVLGISLLFFYYLYKTKGLSVPFSFHPLRKSKMILQNRKNYIHTKKKNKQQEVIDKILEKISQEGIESLTSKENKILINASEQLKKQRKSNHTPKKKER